MIVVERPVRYHESAAELFASLGAASTGDAVLLESADIQSKEGLKSIAILRGSVRITCQGNRVVAQALTPSGVGIVRRLAQQLPDYVDSSGASGGDDAAGVAAERRPARIFSGVLRSQEQLTLLQLRPTEEELAAAGPFAEDNIELKGGPGVAPGVIKVLSHTLLASPEDM